MFGSRVKTFVIRGSVPFPTDKWMAASYRHGPRGLDDREYGKGHLSGETDCSSRRSGRGKLIHQRSTEYGTEPDLSRHQHQERDEPPSMIEREHFASH
jgi:hypothetical protein